MLSAGDSREDLCCSRELLGCFAFAYPYGAFNDETIELLKETGYKMALPSVPVMSAPEMILSGSNVSASIPKLRSKICPDTGKL